MINPIMGLKCIKVKFRHIPYKRGIYGSNFKLVGHIVEPYEFV